MARLFIDYYNSEQLKYKQAYYNNLPVKARRHFAAQEYLDLGKGSQRYLSRVFNCSRNTIAKGVKEILSPDFRPDYSTQRSKGGGRKKKKTNTTY
jgi:hypothetical protein